MTKANKAHAAIYREAARRIAEDEQEYSCLAVRDAAGTHTSCRTDPAVLRYLGIVDHSASHLQEAIYFASRGEQGPDVPLIDDAWCRDFRVLLLCFVAAAVEAGGCPEESTHG